MSPQLASSRPSRNSSSKLLGVFLSIFIAIPLCQGEAQLTRGAGMSARHEPVNVIFDTDIWGDIDDALALAMLHALQARREVNILAVTISTDDKWCASYVDLVDTFYGHSDIPIGVVRGGVDLTRDPKDWAWVKYFPVNYTQLLSQEKNGDGSPTYPHRLTDGSKAPEAVALLRKTLATQPDGSVVMIQVGFSTNLARLLDSGPDMASPLRGSDLVRTKIRLLSAMAGNFGGRHKGMPEFNLGMDVRSAQKVFDEWPTPIVASGIENMPGLFPASSIEHDFAYVANHPIAEAYRAFGYEGKYVLDDTEHKIALKWPYDGGTIDLTSVLYAVRPASNYFSLSKPGKITVLPGGASRFDESEAGNHRYLISTEEQKGRVLEAMILLSSQPPVRGGVR